MKAPRGFWGLNAFPGAANTGGKAAAWGRRVGTGGPQTERACRHSHRGAQPGFPSVQEKNRNNTEKMDLARPCRWKKETWPPPRPTGAQGLVGTGRGRRHETTVTRDQVSPQPVDRGSESLEIKFPTPAVKWRLKNIGINKKLLTWSHTRLCGIVSQLVRITAPPS